MEEMMTDEQLRESMMAKQAMLKEDYERIEQERQSGEAHITKIKNGYLVQGAYTSIRTPQLTYCPDLETVIAEMRLLLE